MKYEKIFTCKTIAFFLKKKTYIAYPLAGIEIDLLIRRKRKMLGIDLIRYAGDFGKAFTLERYKMLHRADLHILPLPYTLCLYDKERCLREIENRF